MAKLLSYCEWMTLNKYWAGRDASAHAYYQKMYGIYVARHRKEEKERNG